MITLKVSFLLAIKLQEVAPIPKGKPGKKGKKGHERSVSKTKNRAKSPQSKKAKVKKKNEDDDDDTFSTIEVKNPISYVHIDYTLFGKKFKYDADVVCWESVAKIFTKHGTKSVKTVIRDDVVWVPVFLEHYLNPLTTEEIRKLLQEIIVLNVNIGKQFVGKKAQSDKSSKFFLHKDDVNNEYFPEVIGKKPDKNDEPCKDQMDRIWKKLLTFPVERDIVTWMYNMDGSHAFKIAKIVTKRSLGQEIHCKDFYDDGKSKAGGKDKKGKKGGKKGSKKSKKGKSRKKSSLKEGLEVSKKMNFKIPAHVLLSDPALATYQVNNTGTILHELYVLLSSNDILTNEQKLELCPLLVKIRKVTNLLEDTLKANGFQSLYVHCNIPGITEFKTSLRPVANTIHFDESRFIITTDLPPMNVAEVLETRRVFTKIIGVKEAEGEKKQESKKDKKKKDKSKKSKSMKSSRNAELDIFHLAGATFDLSSLSSRYFLFKEKGQCYSMESLPLENRSNPDVFFLDHFTMNEVNLNNSDRIAPNSPLTNPTMFLNGTFLKFEARFLIPTFPLHHIRDASQTYKRVLLILFKRELAESLLREILLHNHHILGERPLIPNLLIQRRNPSVVIDKSDDHQVISGFCIDDGNAFILYVEGPSNGYILNLLHKVSRLNYSSAKVFYNSEYVFQERLYDTFNKYSGLFFITLKLPLVDIFADAKIYVEGNAPFHCLKTIQKLSLILNSTTFKSILSYELLPTEIELMSFSVEFGFQFRYKSTKLDLDENGWLMTRSSTDLFGAMSLK